MKPPRIKVVSFVKAFIGFVALVLNFSLTPVLLDASNVDTTLGNILIIALTALIIILTTWGIVKPR